MVAFAAMFLEEMAAAAGDDVDTREAGFRAKGSLAALGSALAAWVSDLAHEIELRWFGTIAVTVGHDDGSWELSVSSSEPRPTAEQARGALARLEGHLRAHLKKVAREE